MCHTVEACDPQGVPVPANVDFGHTTPILTIPLGGWAKLKIDTSGGNSELVISKQ
ncbi:hypothetical protein [Parendozoicomonas callyspongiae]|uniref:hypothetical protein n=1 Tax=Parendozoicomonas callyspongiae TaxID=2942213 RepID=UPI0038CD93C1